MGCFENLLYLEIDFLSWSIYGDFDLEICSSNWGCDDEGGDGDGCGKDKGRDNDAACGIIWVGSGGIAILLSIFFLDY